MDAQNRAVTNALLQLKQIASFFSESTTPLRNGLVGLISIITYMIYSLNLGTRQRNAQNDIIAPTDIDFTPLVIAAKGGVDEAKDILKKSNRSQRQKKQDIDDSKFNEKLSEARLLLLSDS